jgi:cytidylate kinase
MIITIDGGASTGKTTVAITLSIKLQYHFMKTSLKIPFYFLDTGIVYRSFAYDQKYIDNIAFERFELSNEDDIYQLANLKIEEFERKYKFLYSEDISLKTSKISQVKEVREKITVSIRESVLNLKKKIKCGVVLTGRDCGTVIFRDADYKVFLFASTEVKAKRRLKQYQKMGLNITYEEVFEKIKKRDEEDRKRTLSPLLAPDKLGPDFLKVNTDNLTIKEVVELIFNYIVSG